MKLTKLLRLMQDCGVEHDDPEVEFVGIKWQEEHHPSAELFPIELLTAKSTGKGKVTLKFITTKHNQ